MQAVQRFLLRVVIALRQHSRQVRLQVDDALLARQVAFDAGFAIVVHVWRHRAAVGHHLLAQFHHLQQAGVVVVAADQQQIPRGHHEHRTPADRDAFQHVRQQRAADVVAVFPGPAMHARRHFHEVVGRVTQVIDGDGQRLLERQAPVGIGAVGQRGDGFRMVQRQQHHAVVAERPQGGAEVGVVAVRAQVVHADRLDHGPGPDHRPQQRAGLGQRGRPGLVAGQQGRDIALQRALALAASGFAIGVIGVVQVEVRAFAVKQPEFIRFVVQRAGVAPLPDGVDEKPGELVLRGLAPEQRVE
ncbi:hypothetical protein WJ967_16140 [Achromobacter xylosoxidans]